MVFRLFGKYDPNTASDKEREEHNSRNRLHGAYGGTSSYYGPKGDGPGSYVKTGYRYATTQSPGGRGSNRKEISVYTWMPDSTEQQAPAPKPAPVAPKPVLPTISEEAKQYRADTMKILQQADERMKAFEVQRGKDEAARAAQRAQDEAARVERERIAAQTASARSANMMRAGQAPNLQIQPASQTPTTGGTQPFKRRRMQIGGVSPYLGLSISS